MLTASAKRCLSAQSLAAPPKLSRASRRPRAALRAPGLSSLPPLPAVRPAAATLARSVARALAWALRPLRRLRVLRPRRASSSAWLRGRLWARTPPGRSRRARHIGGARCPARHDAPRAARGTMRPGGSGTARPPMWRGALRAARGRRLAFSSSKLVKQPARGGGLLWSACGIVWISPPPGVRQGRAAPPLIPIETTSTLLAFGAVCRPLPAPSPALVRPRARRAAFSGCAPASRPTVACRARRAWRRALPPAAPPGVRGTSLRPPLCPSCPPRRGRGKAARNFPARLILL